MSTHRLLPNARGRRSHAGRRLLLLTGTPGTGKRQLGSYLELQRGFAHLDLDNREARTRYLRSGVEELRSELAALAAANRKVVVTWTVASETQLPYIEALRSLGFEWVWMDSDRGAAYDAVIARDAPVKPPLFVDAFEVDGRFRALEAITGELRRRRAPLPRAPLPLPRRPAARLRIAPPPFRRPAWAGVAAFAAAAAAAGGAYLAGAFAPSQPARVSLAHRALPAQLPVSAVFVPGKSLGGIALGATEAEVRAAWGHRFTVCQGCTPTTWFYMSPTGDPFGAGVSFRHGR